MWGHQFTPGSKTSADYASLGTIDYDAIRFPSETVFNIPAGTIQAAIDGPGPINARINISPRAYYETLKFDRANSSHEADRISVTIVQIVIDMLLFESKLCFFIIFEVDQLFVKTV